MVKVVRSKLGDLSVLLHDTFLISSDRKGKFKQTFILITNVLMSLTCAVSIYFLRLERSLDGAANLAVLTVTNAIKHMIYFFRRNELKKLLDITVKIRDHHKEEWEREMFEAGSKDAWDGVHKYNVILTTYVFVLVLGSMTDFVIGLILPDAFSVRVHLPCEGLLDFLNPHSLESFVFTVVILLWCFEAITIDIGCESLTIIPIMYTKIEIKIIIKKLALIKGLLNNKEFGNRIQAEKMFREVISQHQTILE